MVGNNRRPSFQQKNVREAKHRINRFIVARELRLTGDNITNPGSIVTLETALSIAREQELDLVEISPNASPPVAKVIDYQKFLYNEEKKQKEMSKKQKETNKPVKEVQITPNIGINDVETKVKHMRDFLKSNHKVKLVMKFKQGREIHNLQKKGEDILNAIADELSDCSKTENEPKLSGKTMIINFAPKK